MTKPLWGMFGRQIRNSLPDETCNKVPEPHIDHREFPRPSDTLAVIGAADRLVLGYGCCWPFARPWYLSVVDVALQSLVKCPRCPIIAYLSSQHVPQWFSNDKTSTARAWRRFLCPSAKIYVMLNTSHQGSLRIGRAYHIQYPAPLP